MPKTQHITLFSQIGEDEGGRAIYDVRVYEAMYETHIDKNEERDGIVGHRHITGFLFARDEEYLETAKEYGRIPINIGRDIVCAGDVSDYESPTLAEHAGHTLYTVESVAQPPRYDDGMLSDWCHFTARSKRARYT